MEKVSKILALVLVLGVVGWFFSQLGGEPRFAKFQGPSAGGRKVVGPAGAAGLGTLGLSATGKAPGRAQGPGLEVAVPTTGPTIGPPPLNANPDNGDPSRPDQPVYFVDKDLSRYASKSTVPLTRIHQILIEGGHGDVAKKVRDFQNLLKEVRRGEEPEVESLAAEQADIVVEVGKVLTGPEVEDLLERIQSELERLEEAEADKQLLAEEEEEGGQ